RRFAEIIRTRHLAVSQLPKRARTGAAARQAALRSRVARRGRRLRSADALNRGVDLVSAATSSDPAVDGTPALLAHWGARADIALAAALPAEDQPPLSL